MTMAAHKVATHRGFTLIELMIVVAIIAILAAIALPALQQYVGRAQLTEAIVQAGAAKLAVIESTNPPNLPADNAAAGLGAPNSLSSHYVTSVTVTNGQISVKLSSNTRPALHGKHLLLTPTVHGKRLWWECSSADIDPSYLPGPCR